MMLSLLMFCKARRAACGDTQGSLSAALQPIMVCMVASLMSCMAGLLTLCS